MASVERYTPGNPVIVRGLEASGPQSYKAGDLVKLSSGYVAVGDAGAFVGIARRNATGTAGSAAEVELLDPNAVYSVRYKASATGQALVGDAVDFTFSPAGAYTVSETGGSGTDAYVVDLDSRDPVTTSGGRLLIRFKSTVFAATT